MTASYHISIPPRHNAVFEVNIHAETQGTQIITANIHLLEKHPSMYQHEISIIAEKDSKSFPLAAITNLDQVKTVHLAKGEVVGFARPESPNVTYIAMTHELNIEETVDIVPRNWIPNQKWNLKSLALRRLQGTGSKNCNYSLNSQKIQEVTKAMEEQASTVARKGMISMFQKSTSESHEGSENLLLEGAVGGFNISQHIEDCFTERHEPVEQLRKSLDQQWGEISEVIESDFFISPGDIYLNRKVQLEDADIKDTFKAAFEVLCEQQHEAFSKNNKDIGRTQLIEMEIDTGDSLPVSTITIHITTKALRLGAAGDRTFGKIWCNLKKFIQMGLTNYHSSQEISI